MTEPAHPPFVLIVDDRPMEDFADLVEDYGVEARAVHPKDVDMDLLGRASAVIIDQFLDDWPGRSPTPLALCVPDGLSLAAVLRSHLEQTGSRQAEPRTAAFAIRTGEFDNLAAHLPRAARAHLLAAQRDLEWVFDKKEQPGPGHDGAAKRVAALALAAGQLPGDWSEPDVYLEVEWLALPQDVQWLEEARWQVEQCRPPRHIVAASTAGRAWLRWFLQKILPYPTFLLDTRRAAMLLGLQEEAFVEVVAGESPLSIRLAAVRYRGACATFLGQRWWRAGLRALVTEACEDDNAVAGLEPSAVAAALTELHGAPLDPVTVDRPVLRVGADYETLPGPIDAAAAARLQPDDWPPYADDAWADQTDLTDERIRGLVVELDRWRLGGDGAGNAE